MTRLPLALLLAAVAAAAPAAAAADDGFGPAFALPASPGDRPADLAADVDGVQALAATTFEGRSGAVAVTLTLRDPATGAVVRNVFRAPKGDNVLAPRVAITRRLATMSWTRYRGPGSIRVLAVRCTMAGCGRVQTLGRGQRVKTMAAPAVTADGRSLVLWRGSSAHGGPRLQWAVTSFGRFGPVHTLGEFADQLDVATAADERVVALWTGAHGTRTAERGSGEFTRPRTVGAATPAAEPRLAVAGAEVLAAWRGGTPDGEGSPGAGTAFVAIRAAATSGFGAPQAVATGEMRDLSLGADGAGRAVLAFGDLGTAPPDQTTSENVGAAIREPGAAFGAPVTLDDTSFLYVTPQAAVDDAGRASVVWEGRAQSPPGGPIIASESAPNGPLAARQVLALGGTAALAAAGDGRALAVWSTGSAIAAAQRPATP
ncbi:MAG: hypothetical protein QOJ82_581 [Solirubrobacteraceae bacterium]|jgi:hypothetical protein|nr:hypothetical protein [Solirubrobacteraceae bacterium]